MKFEDPQMPRGKSGAIEPCLIGQCFWCEHSTTFTLAISYEDRAWCGVKCNKCGGPHRLPEVGK